MSAADQVLELARSMLAESEQLCDDCNGALGPDDVHQDAAEVPGHRVIEIRCPHCRSVLWSRPMRGEERAA